MQRLSRTDLSAWLGPRQGSVVGMEDMNRLILHVLPVQDSDVAELADLGDQLRAELLEYDVVSVVPLPGGEAPPGAKGIGQVAGWLVAQFGTLDGLRAVLNGVRSWAARTQRAVEVTVGDKTLIVEAATKQQQQDLIDAFLAQLDTRA
jgi:hypothetical protein